MKRKTIGVVGYGFVGQAVAKGFCNCADVLVYDEDPEKGLFWWSISGYVGKQEIEGLEDSNLTPLEFLVEKCSIIFVCVPTPMKPDGSCDTLIVEEVVQALDKGSIRLALACDQRPVVVIKSTVPPGTTADLQGKYKWINLVFNPEFLTEANSERDFAEQNRVIIGGAKGRGTPGVGEVCELYREFGIVRNVENQKKNPNASWCSPVIDVCTSTEAEMVKYLMNCFLAVKVSLANEFAQVCEKIGVDWETVWVIASIDERLGVTHWAVPGPDGHKGFGGSCFPKDVNGMIRFMAEHGVLSDTLTGAWATNLAVRSERDWEDLKGRAVV